MRRLLMIVVFLPLFSFLGVTQSSDGRSDDRAYIKQAKSDWAESVVTNDVSVLERILADDFVGVFIDGSHYSKADAIKDFRTHPSDFASKPSQRSRDSLLRRRRRRSGQ